MSELADLYCVSLEHFIKKLIQLQDDDEIKQGNSIIKSEIEKTIKEANRQKEFVESHGARFYEYSEALLIKKSLEVYKKDLISSRTSLNEKLGTELDLKQMDDDLEFIEKTINHIDNLKK